MTPQRAATATTTIVLLIIIIVLVGAMGAVLLSSQPVTHTPTFIVTQTTTIVSERNYTVTITVNKTSQTNTISTCAVNFMSAGTYLRIISDSTQQPLSGISVHVSQIANSTCYGHGSPANYDTNSSGWISMGALEGGAYFEASLEHAGRSYEFSIPAVSLDVSYATISVPSGNLNITVCYTPAKNSGCTTHNQTATTTSTTT